MFLYPEDTHQHGNVIMGGTAPAAYKIKENMQIDKMSQQYLDANTSFNSFMINKQKYSVLQKDMHKIQQWNIKNGLYMNLLGYGEHLIDKIMNIRFTELKVLSLKNNKIRSIQMLCQLHMPSLTQLFLGTHENMSDGEDNFITDIRSIRRCHFQNLSILYLPKMSRNLSAISEMFVPEIGTISINGIKCRWDCSSKWIYKLQSPSVILLQNTGFLGRKLANSICKKFRQADFRSRYTLNPIFQQRGAIPMRRIII